MKADGGDALVFRESFEHLALQLPAGLACLGKARSIDNGTTAADLVQMPHDLDSELAPHRNEGGIGTAIDLFDRFDAGDACQLFALGMDRPDLAGEAQSAGAIDGDSAFTAANEGNGFGREEAGEACGHG